MGIQIKGNVEHVTNFEKDGIQINIFDSPEHLARLHGDLENIKSLASNEEKEEIQNALNGLSEKNEGKVIAALKKISPFVGRVASTVAGNTIIAYMKINGLIP